MYGLHTDLSRPSHRPWRTITFDRTSTGCETAKEVNSMAKKKDKDKDKGSKKDTKRDK